MGNILCGGSELASPDERFCGFKRKSSKSRAVVQQKPHKEDTAQSAPAIVSTPENLPSVAESPNAPDTAIFKSESDTTMISNKVCFGAGCYWGTEKYFMSDFNKNILPGIIKSGHVGFMGPEGSPDNPTYRDVCTKRTGHVEVFYLEYEPSDKNFEALVRFFFQFHDPTTFNRQGNDKGSQYASVIYCYDEIQEKIAKNVIDELQELITSKVVTCFKEGSVSTTVRRSTVFYIAEELHQRYLENNPNGYCNHRIRFNWPTATPHSNLT